jgi:hemerythrin
MAATRFASGNCHAMQHKVVLQVMREGAVRAADHGELQVVRAMAAELALWFPQHAQSMDAALALHLRRVGFDAATGEVHAPDALPEGLIHGCGGSSCSDEGSHASVAAA